MDDREEAVVEGLKRILLDRIKDDEARIKRAGGDPEMTAYRRGRRDALAFVLDRGVGIAVASARAEELAATPDEMPDEAAGR